MEFYDDCAFCREYYGMECQDHPGPLSVEEPELFLIVAVDEPAAMTCGFCGYPLLPGEDTCYNC